MPVTQSTAIRARTGGGAGSPTARRLPIVPIYDRFVPRGNTATGPHGIYPGTGHVAKLDRITHPGAVRSVTAVKPPKIKPKPKPRPGRPVVRPPTVGGQVVEVGGFVQQQNAGGTTSGVGGGSAARAATGGYFANLTTQTIGGLSAVTVAELAALAVGGVLVARHFGKGKRRRR